MDVIIELIKIVLGFVGLILFGIVLIPVMIFALAMKYLDNEKKK